MGKFVYTLFTFLFSLSLLAQQETNRDSVFIRKDPIEISPELQKYLDDQTQTQFMEPEVPETNAESHQQDSIYMGIPSLKYNEYIYKTPLITSFGNPFAYDFSKYGSVYLSPRSMILTQHYRETVPTMGTLIKTGVNYHYLINDYITLNTGIYGAKYSIGPAIMNDFGVNGGLSFKVNDRIRFHAIGRYSAMANKNQIGGPMSPFYPSTAFGGIMEVKITDRFGIGGGMEREFDPVKNKWINKPVFYPIFYK